MGLVVGFIFVVGLFVLGLVLIFVGVYVGVEIMVGFFYMRVLMLVW